MERRTQALPRKGAGTGTGRARGRRPPGTDLLALGAVLALLSAIAFAFGGKSGPVSDENMEAPLTVLVVDVSPSMLRPRPGIRRWLLSEVESETRAARLAGHEVALLTYGRRAVRRFGPGPADGLFAALREGGADWFRGSDVERQAEVDGEPGTDLRGALVVALNLHRSGLRPMGKTVLIGDGTFTGDDPKVLFSEPRLGDLKWIEPEPGTRPDLAVVRVRVPKTVEPGVPVRCQVDLRLAHGQALPESAEVLLDWTLGSTSVVALGRGRNRPKWSQGQASEPVPPEVFWAAKPSPTGHVTVAAFSVPVVLPAMEEGSGELLVSASLLRHSIDRGSPSPPVVADAFPESNYGRAEWTVGDPTRVLVVAPSSREAAERIAALFVGPVFDGIEFLTGTSSSLEGQLSGGRPPHVILTSGLPVAALPGPALKAFVMDGGGWFHSEGWSSLRVDRGVLGPLLALEPDVEPREPRNIVFLVDGSGSMKGPRWQRAKYALAQLLPSIPEDDRLQLRFFNLVLGKANIEFEAAPASATEEERAQRRRVVMARLRDLQIPGGSTDIIGSVGMFVREREKAVAAGDERSSLVIVISDGRSTISGTASKPVRSTLMEFGDEIVAIQVGGDVGFRGPLSELAGAPQNIVLAGELQGVLGILQEAVQGAQPIEDALMLSVPPRVTEFSDLIEESTRLALLTTALVIHQALPCRVVDGATALFEIQEDAPDLDSGAPDGGGVPRRGVLAAVASRGLGTTAGLALPILDPEGNRWAPELLERPQWMAPIFREMRQRFERAKPASGQGPAEPAATIETGGAARRIVVRHLPPGAPSEIRGEIHLLGTPRDDGSGATEVPIPPGVVADLRLMPPTFGGRGASTRTAPRPHALDLYPRGTSFELRLLDAGGRGDSLSLGLVGDGSSESDATLEPAPHLRQLGEGIVPGSMGAPSRGGASGSRGALELVMKGRSPGHPVAPWLALAAGLALFLGALGRQVQWRSASG